MSAKGEIYEVLIRKGPKDKGIGLEISMQKTGAITVKGVSGFAYRTGIIAIGDTLVQINETSVVDLDFKDVVNLVRAIKPLATAPFKFKRGDKIPDAVAKRSKEDAAKLTSVNDKSFYEGVSNIVKSMCISNDHIGFLSVKELRMKAKSMDIDTRNCTEKSDMVKLIQATDVVPTTYDVRFEVKEAHGISLEKVNEWGIIKKGPTSLKVGSALVGINSVSVALLLYSDTTTLLRNASYPLVLTLMSTPTKKGFLFKRSKGGWKRRYFVLEGGWLRYYEDENADLEKDMQGELELQNEEDPETNKASLTTVTMAPTAMLDSEGEPAIMIAKGEDRLIVKGQTSESLKAWAAALMYATGVANGGNPFMKEMETRRLDKLGKLGEATEKLQEQKLAEQAKFEKLAQEAKLEMQRAEEEKQRALEEADKAMKEADALRKEADAEKDAAVSRERQLSEATAQLAELKLAKEKAEKELKEAKEKAEQIKVETELQISQALEQEKQAELARKEAAKEAAQQAVEVESEREKQAEKTRLELAAGKAAEDQAIIDAVESFEKGAEMDDEIFAKNVLGGVRTFRGDKAWIGAKDDSEFTFTNF